MNDITLILSFAVGIYGVVMAVAMAVAELMKKR